MLVTFPHPVKVAKCKVSIAPVALLLFTINK